ncbi:MAG: hypothetical protein PHY15_06745 [Eubacteriales bacterium]|nr:hypothetical protein [Eubacteriales bacterium]
MSQEVINLFDQINVKNTERISEWDRECCIRHQEYYEFAVEKTLKIIALAKEISKEDSIYGINQDDLGRRSGYFDTYDKEVKLTEKNAFNDLMSMQKKFIGFIISHFESAYKVSLDSGKAIETIFSGEPERISHFASEGEIKKYEERVQAYEKQFESLISYEKVIDYIFAELGGKSFKNRAADEIREACRATFTGYNGRRSYYGPDLKGKALEFKNFLDIRDEYSWDKGGSIHDIYYNSSAYKLFNALSLYLHGSTENVFNTFLSRLSEKHGRDLICEHNAVSSRLEGIRIYKNGKMVIKFKEAQKALEFAKEYCNYCEEQVAI